MYAVLFFMGVVVSRRSHLQVLNVGLAEALEARLEAGGVRIDEVAVVQVAGAAGAAGAADRHREGQVGKDGRFLRTKSAKRTFYL